MTRQLSFRTSASPESILQALEDLADSFPSRARLRPSHVVAMHASIEPPNFTLECERDYREYFGPVCVGSVDRDGASSHVTAQIRRSRWFLVVPGLILFMTIVGWLEGSGPSTADIVLLAVALPLVVGWPWLMSFFSTADHEAEADAFSALLRQCVDRAEEDEPAAVR